MSQQLSFDRLLVGPIALGATTPNPGGPSIVWSTITSGLLAWNGTEWSSLIYDPELKTLEQLNTFGFVVRDPVSGNFVTRQLLGTPNQITVVDGNGANPPVISLTNTGVPAGTYTKVTVDEQGRVLSAGQLAAEDIPASYLNLYRERYVNSAPYPVALGDNAVATGSAAQATAASSHAHGEHAVARHKGAHVRASGRFQTSGDCQTGLYILKAVTTNTFSREMYLDGPGGTTALVLPDDSTWTFKATVTAHRTDGSDGHAGFFIKGVIYRGAGPSTVSFQGNPTVEVLGRSNLNWNINTSANTVDGSLSFTVQGEASKVIRWAASIETVEITN